MAQDKKIDWIVKGKTFRNLGKTNPEELDDISLSDLDNGLKMPGRSIFGQPIDAQLAVHYIRKLWTTLDNMKLLSTHTDTSKLIERLQDDAVGLISKDEEKKKEFNKIMNQILEQSKNQQWLIDLLHNSAAITIDKSALLRTLSQPACEGIRFYLCMKDQKEEGPHMHHDINEILTLLSVGVDKSGYDLNFREQGEKLRVPLEGNKLPDIENSSLCNEYPCNSGDLNSKSFNSEDLKPYVLFRFAWIAKQGKDSGSPEEKV